MNLHGIVSGAIGAVNPFVSAIVRKSTGYTTNPGGSRTPTYTDMPVSLQVQSLTYTDLTQLDSLNIQGTRRAIYLSGDVEGLIRVDKLGGDLVIFATGVLPEGTIWLAAQVLERWPGWVKVCITLQNGK